MKKISIILVLVFLAAAAPAMAQQNAPQPFGNQPHDTLQPEGKLKMPLKDLVDLRNARDNYIQGMGLVVGLNGTGDSPRGLAPDRLAVHLSQAHDWLVTPTDIQSRNIALVKVTATLPAFARKGSRFDVQVSSIGDARSLEGGTLIVTPLRGPGAIHQKIPQSQVFFATAQGQIFIDGEEQPLNGSIPNGAILEMELKHEFEENRVVTLQLRNPDFQLAFEIENVINTELVDLYGIEERGPRAKAETAASVSVQIPDKFWGYEVAFVSALLSMSVQVPIQHESKVVINRGSGLVTVSGNVIVLPGLVHYGAGQKLNIKRDSKLQEVIENLSIAIPKEEMVAVVLELYRANLIRGKVEVR